MQPLGFDRPHFPIFVNRKGADGELSYDNNTSVIIRNGIGNGADDPASTLAGGKEEWVVAEVMILTASRFHPLGARSGLRLERRLLARAWRRTGRILEEEVLGGGGSGWKPEGETSGTIQHRGLDSRRRRWLE